MKRAMRSMLGGLSIITLAWLSFASQGCGRPSFREVCQETCGCFLDEAAQSAPVALVCLDPDVDLCVDLVDQARQRAVEQGCADAFEAMISCAAVTDRPCGSTGSCQPEIIEYHQCGG
jgi:hypothetical protein